MGGGGEKTYRYSLASFGWKGWQKIETAAITSLDNRVQTMGVEVSLDAIFGDGKEESTRDDFLLL